MVIANARQYDTGGCGQGFLDNMHGHGCSVFSWGCNYANDPSGVPYLEANFAVDLLCNPSDVESAIWNAFGHLDGIGCITYAMDVELPPTDLPPE